MKGICLKAISAAVFLIAGVGCGPSETVPPPIDAGPPDDAGDACPGNGLCAPGPTGTWRGPVILWAGPEADAPPCPASADLETYTGHADPEGPACGVCTCAPPTGSCASPATLTAAAATCAGDGSGVTHTSFDPPASWDGTCTDANAIPAGKLCGGVPCVQSVTIAPLTLEQGGCLPIHKPPQAPTHWKTFARACTHAVYPSSCGSKGSLCAPPTPGPDFKICVFNDRLNPLKTICPPAYPDKHVFHPGPDPFCSDCACEAPTGSSCSGSISLFQNGTCGAAPIASASINAKGPTCVDVPPGSALGSAKASALNYYAGSCAPSGGTPESMVFCCMP